MQEEQKNTAGGAETPSEELERLSRIMERESRRYPADFGRRGGI